MRTLRIESGYLFILKTCVSDRKQTVPRGLGGWSNKAVRPRCGLCLRNGSNDFANSYSSEKTCHWEKQHIP